MGSGGLSSCRIFFFRSFWEEVNLGDEKKMACWKYISRQFFDLSLQLA